MWLDSDVAMVEPWSRIYKMLRSEKQGPGVWRRAGGLATWRGGLKACWATGSIAFTCGCVSVTGSLWTRGTAHCR